MNAIVEKPLQGFLLQLDLSPLPSGWSIDIVSQPGGLVGLTLGCESRLIYREIDHLSPEDAADQIREWVDMADSLEHPEYSLADGEDRR